MNPFPGSTQHWKWGTPAGSREFDRLLDRQMSLAEKLDWLEQAETLALALAEWRQTSDKHIQRQPQGKPTDRPNDTA